LQQGLPLEQPEETIALSGSRDLPPAQAQEQELQAAKEAQMLLHVPESQNSPSQAAQVRALPLRYHQQLSEPLCRQFPAVSSFLAERVALLLISAHA